MAELPLAVRIDKAIAWFDANWARILMALPMTVGETTFLPCRRVVEDSEEELQAKPVKYYSSAAVVVEQWVELWQSGQIDLGMAQVYVLEPIRKMYRGLKERGEDDGA